MILIAALLLLSLAAVSEASMSDQVVQGSVYDQRISACGMVVSTGRTATLRPFIETSSVLSGTVRLSVTKRSASGTSQTGQRWAFSGTVLGGSQVTVDVPAEVLVELQVLNGAGSLLCRLDQELTLGAKRDAGVSIDQRIVEMKNADQAVA